jgi:hypothetical protein
MYPQSQDYHTRLERRVPARKVHFSDIAERRHRTSKQSYLRIGPAPDSMDRCRDLFRDAKWQRREGSSARRLGARRFDNRRDRETRLARSPGN